LQLILKEDYIVATYKITFNAELSEIDLRAMNKCFYDAMNEAMGIEEVWGLKLEKVEDEE
jgi:hypothetical protein